MTSSESEFRFGRIGDRSIRCAEMFTEENRLLPNVPIRQEANDGRGKKRQGEKGQRGTP
jgi:hypothetical protein